MSNGSASSAAEQVTSAGSLADAVEEYRNVRGVLERGVLPLATSVDGRQFTFQASLHDLQFQTGGYVVLEGSRLLPDLDLALLASFVGHRDQTAAVREYVRRLRGH